MNRYEGWKLAEWREVDHNPHGSLIEFAIDGPNGERERLQFWFDTAQAVDELLDDCLDEIIDKAVINRDANRQPPTI